MTDANHTRAVAGPTTSPGAPPLPPGGQSPESGPRRMNGSLAVVAALAFVGAAAWLGWVLLGGDDRGDVAGSTSSTAVVPVEGFEGQAGGATATEPAAAQPEETTVEGPLSTEQLARRVVQIQLLLDGQAVCTGSGTIVSPDGLVLTNSHVISQSSACPHDTIAVAVVDDPDTAPTVAFEADLLVDAPDLDLAVVRIARSTDGSAVPSFDAVPIGDSSAVGLGDELRILGFPGIGGDTITATTGRVSGFVDTSEGGARSWIKTDATIAGGNSGGLAADAEGRIVGIPTQVGAGSGNVVDCRFLADSNGDGRLDGEDSCVPTGGFLNGVRPVEFAQALLTQAATAAPIPIAPPDTTPQPSTDAPFAHSAAWSLGVDADGFAVDPIVSGSGATTQVCLTWVYENVPRGAAFDLVWSLDGVTGPGDVSSGTNQGETSGDFFGCYGSGQSPIGPGRLEARWEIDGAPVFSEAIYVGPNREAVSLTIVNQSDESLCVVAATPAGSASFGTNDLRDLVDPGASVTLDVARGEHDLAVVDCVGQVVLELRGLVVDETLGPVAVS